MTGRIRGRPRATRDPYGIGPAAQYLWPAVAAVALVVIAIVSLGLVQGQLPFTRQTTGSGTGGDTGPLVTPAPSNKVIVPAEVTFHGSIAYAKAGNICIQTSTRASQITEGGGGRV